MSGIFLAVSETLQETNLLSMDKNGLSIKKQQLYFKSMW